MNQEEINLVMTLIEQVSVNNKEDLHARIWQKIKDLESMIEDINIHYKLQEGSDTVLSTYPKKINDVENNVELLKKRIIDLEATILTLSDSEDKNGIISVNQANKNKDLREVSLGDVMTQLDSWHYTNLNDVLSRCNSRVYDLIYKTLKISTLGELMMYSAPELLSYKNFGKISLASLNRDLTKFSPESNLEILEKDGDDDQYIDLTLSKE
tara:strand:+ start:84 stop:716 length:633 start_codon:yes stop_codon:yes gene_type:complete